jgi:RIP homotypic interaction motif
LPEIASIDPNPYRLFNICKQLGEHGLIKWVDASGLTSFGGMGRITARGVDVVEGTVRAPITVTLHHHSISVSHSSNVQIGDSNKITQAMGIQLDDLSRFVTELSGHLDELKLDARQKARAETQIASLKAELDGEPDAAIVKQAGHTLRNITEGAIGSLLAAAPQPSVWQWIHQVIQKF